MNRYKRLLKCWPFLYKSLKWLGEFKVRRLRIEADRKVWEVLDDEPHIYFREQRGGCFESGVEVFLVYSKSGSWAIKKVRRGRKCEYYNSQLNHQRRGTPVFRYIQKCGPAGLAYLVKWTWRKDIRREKSWACVSVFKFDKARFDIRLRYEALPA